MAKSKGRSGSSGNTGGNAPTINVAAPEPAAPKKKTNPIQFAKEVRAEARKITWTTRKETWITSVMVLIMVVIAAVFFFVVDWLLSGGVALLLKLANAG